MRAAAAIGVLCLMGVGLSPNARSPARYRTGAVPALPAAAVGGGEVFLEVAVSAAGDVTAVTPLRTTPPFADVLARAVGGWRFRPAEEDPPQEAGRAGGHSSRVSVASTVLVVGVFRPPALNPPVLGEIPRDVATASSGTPFPLTTIVPPFPPLARASGVVLVEVRIDRDGAAADATVIRSAPPFDEAARIAARKWRFRPVQVGGLRVETIAYIVFGFPVPVASVPHVPRRP